MMRNPTYQQITIAIAAPKTGSGGASAPPVLTVLPTSRTITNGVLAIVGDSHAEGP